MNIEQLNSLSELEILKLTLLDDLVEKCNFILKAASEGRVNEKETVENVCKNIIALCEQISSEQKTPEQGLKEILSELNIIRKLIENVKMDPRSLVADQCLIMEARVKDRLRL